MKGDGCDPWIVGSGFGALAMTTLQPPKPLAQQRRSAHEGRRLTNAIPPRTRFGSGGREPKAMSSISGVAHAAIGVDADEDEPARIGEYLASHGGPFFELQRRLGVLREDALLAGRRAVMFVALAWGVPLVLSLIAGRAFGPADAHPFLLDFGAWARFFIAIGLFILAEQQVEYGLHGKLGQLVRAPILAPGSFEAAASAVVRALRLRNSVAAEIICLGLAVAGTLARLDILMTADSSTWAVQVADDSAHMTLAGWWSVVCSAPLFYFLLFRGLWRYIVWAMLLWRIASLELRLVATHPDGKGGLAFLAEYPNAYSMFVFGMSSGMAITVVRHVFEANISSVTFGYIITGWLVIVFAFFAFPLLAFSKPLSELKAKSAQVLGAQERALIGRNLAANDAGETAVPAVPDPSAQFAASRKLSIFLMSRAAIAPLAGAALVPFAIAGATKLPYKAVFTLVKKLLVL